MIITKPVMAPLFFFRRRQAACEKEYSKGHYILAHLGNDDGKRSSLIFAWQKVGNN